MGLRGPGFGDIAVWLVFTYLWLPYMILPVYAGLERIPDSLLEASADLGGRSWMTFRRVVLPLVLPGRRRRVDLHVLADARRLHRAELRSRRRSSSATRSTRSSAPATCRLPPRCRSSRSAIVVAVPARRAPAGRVRGALMSIGRGTRLALGIATALILAFIYVPDRADRRLLVQLRDDARLAAGRLHARVVGPGAPQQRPSAGLPDLDRRRARARRRSRSYWGRSRRSRWRATASSGASRSRSWWSCRSRCPASLPAWPSPRRSPRWASRSASSRSSLATRRSAS